MLTFWLIGEDPTKRQERMAERARSLKKPKRPYSRYVLTRGQSYLQFLRLKILDVDKIPKFFFALISNCIFWLTWEAFNPEKLQWMMSNFSTIDLFRSTNGTRRNSARKSISRFAIGSSPGSSGNCTYCTKRFTYCTSLLYTLYTSAGLLHQVRFRSRVSAGGSIVEENHGDIDQWDNDDYNGEIIYRAQNNILKFDSLLGHNNSFVESDEVFEFTTPSTQTKFLFDNISPVLAPSNENQSITPRYFIVL